MMSVTALLELSREIARDVDPRVSVEAIASADGDSGRAEMLVTISRCHPAPCSLLFNIDRSTPATAERDLRTHFVGALADHGMLDSTE